MSAPAAGMADEASRFLDFYERALPQVYGYLLSRCRQVPLAEDLTAETFLAAVEAVGRAQPPDLTIPWIIGVARHKLVDHWRRLDRDERGMRALVDETPTAADPWVHRLEAADAHQALDRLGAHHRAALTLRYIDDLPVPEVAALLERTVHATEALLVRARTAFRKAYGEEAADG